MSKVKIKGYMCGKDWSTDLPLGANDVKVYTSINAIKRARKCVKYCGIVEIEITKKRTVTKGKDNIKNETK